MPVINDPILGTIIGAIIGGGIGIVSGVVVERLKRWLARPKIAINEDTTEADLDLKTDPPMEGLIQTNPRLTKYTGIRIKIENNGESAAEECKATLVTQETELRVGWMIPRKQDWTVTINAHDIEYLDICAMSKDGADRIFTTEHGYGDYVGIARRLNKGVIEAKLKISAKNAKQCVKSIRIFDKRDAQNKIVTFTE